MNRARSPLVLPPIAALAALPSAASGQYYVFQDLGTLGGAASYATGVNDAGQVVGWSFDGQGRERAFLWDQAGGMRDLGTLGGAHSRAAAINEAGQVVGWSLNASSEKIAFLWDSAGGMRPLGHLGTPHSEARDINSQATAVGVSFLADGRERGFIWTPAGGMMAITPPYEPGMSSAYGINDAGSVCGRLSDAQTNRPAFILPPGGSFRTAGLGVAAEINSAGHAVTSDVSDAYLWPWPGAAVSLTHRPPRTLPGTLTARTALSISDAGTAVGSGLLAGGEQRAFRWDSVGGLLELSQLLPRGVAWKLREAADVSNGGRIVGWGADTGGRTRAFLMTPRPVQRVIYVREDAPAGGDGLSCATAYQDLSDALIAATVSNGTVDEVWVARGTYTPRMRTGLYTPQTATFPMPRDVAIYGGFRGDETVREQRDPGANATVLSGDLNGDDSPGFQNRLDNAVNVLTAWGNVDLAFEPRTLDGFIVRGGYRNPGVLSTGGGLRAEGANLRVAGCIFEENHSGNGGAISVLYGAADIRSCRFVGNRSLGNGAGVRIEAAGRIENCEFRGNTTDSGASGLYGLRDANIIGCSFIGNHSSTGFECSAVAITDRCRLINCRIIGNTAQGEGPAGLTIGWLCEVTNCIIAGNAGRQGGVFAYEGPGVGPHVVNTAIAFNRATDECGGIATRSAGLQVSNCILWGNTGAAPTTERRQIALVTGSSVAYSRVEGWTGSLGGQGNSGADPLFVDPLGPDLTPGTEDDDLHLRRPSTSIDGGRNASVRPDAADLDGDLNTVEPTPIDLDGLPRFRCDLNTPATGQGTPPLVDIGPYVFQPPPCPANFNADCRLDIFDFLAFQNAWTLRDPRADLDPNGVFDVFDFLVYLNLYGAGCP